MLWALYLKFVKLTLLPTVERRVSGTSIKEPPALAALINDVIAAAHDNSAFRRDGMIRDEFIQI
jgi:hypothetical protein